jgi:hypothetical protein
MKNVGIFWCHEKGRKRRGKNPIIVNYWYNFLIEVNLLVNQAFDVSFGRSGIFFKAYTTRLQRTNMGGLRIAFDFIN